MPDTLFIATRESRLALWQAEHVRSLLRARFGWRVELLGMTTRGDQVLDRTLSKVGGKGLFVKELEAALEDGRAQLAVHSLKDVPMELPEGFVLGAVLEREDARDAFVSPRFARLDELPRGAVVGTSSLRRAAQLLSLRPDLRIEPLRGNLDTRLRKLDDGQYAAIVLAAAGLKRLGLAGRIRALFDPAQMTPAAGQGALGLEWRASRDDLGAALEALTHRPTWLAATAERAVSRALGGSCSMPLAAHASWQGGQGGQGGESGGQSRPGRHRGQSSGQSGEGGSGGPAFHGVTLQLDAMLGHALDPGRPLLRVQITAPVADDDQARALGEQAAAALRAADHDGYLAAAAQA